MTQPPYPSQQYPHDPYAQDPYAQDPYAQEPYGRQYGEQYAQEPPNVPAPRHSGEEYWYEEPAPLFEEPYQPARAPRPPALSTSGTAVAALVLGILAVLLCWVPLVGIVAWPLLVVGGVLGIVALRQIRRGGVAGRGTAVAGLVCCGVALAVCLFSVIAIGGALH